MLAPSARRPDLSAGRVRSADPAVVGAGDRFTRTDDAALEALIAASW